jgi:hypothetical protein
MNSIWYSLAWKEWHEHKWKLAAAVGTLWSLAVVLILYTHVRDAFGATVSLVIVGLVPFTIFVGLVAASGERARRTIPFLQSLPVPMWRVAVVKIAIAILTLVSAIVLTASFFYVCTLTRSYFAQSQSPGAANPQSLTGSWPLDAILICSTVVASILIWVAATGVNRKDEISAAAASLVVITVWFFAIGFGSYLLFRNQQQPRWLEAAMLAATPAWIVAFAPGSQFAPYWPSSLAVALVVNGSLLAWYVGRFGRVASDEVRSQSSAFVAKTKAGWLPPPRRSALTAIIWKQARESVPVVVVGFAGTVLITGIVVVSNYISLYDPKVFSEAGEAFSRVGVIMGVFVALVLGIGVCHLDMQPGISTFWRTRPINPDTWFFLKFFTGLVVLMASIYLPNAFLALAGAAPISSGIATNQWMLPAIQIATFAAALAVYCLVRQPIYSAILTIPLVYTGLVLVWVSLWIAGRIGWAPEPSTSLNEITDAQATIGFGISFVISSILAWLAMRLDWGWKSRY